MSKRKREDQDAPESLPTSSHDRATSIRTSRLSAKLSQGSKTLHSALKLARGFERQKLGRRQKAAKSEPKTLLKLKEEVISLKSLDLQVTAEKYLIKQCIKTKRIGESAALGILLRTEWKERAGQDGKEAEVDLRVKGRLFNSVPVKEALGEVRSGIYQCLGIEEFPKEGHSRPKEFKTAVPALSQTKSANAISSNGSFDGFSDSEDGQEETIMADIDLEDDDDDDDDEDDEDEAMTMYDSRIAASSDEEDDQSDDEPMRAYDNRINASWSLSPSQSAEEDEATVSKRSRDLSISASPSPSLSPSPPPTSTRQASRPKPIKTATTTFLPSLTMGGYFSGSESDSDADVDPSAPRAKGPPLPIERKNRRGQRARQQIAERKFGQQAKAPAKGAEGRT